MVATRDISSAARWYINAGARVVPIPARQKRPVVNAWQKLAIAADEVEGHFSGDGNIGIILGDPSGGLVDIDLDCPEAVDLAHQFLPPTGCVSGHDGRPNSHWWYIAPGMKTRPFKVANDTIVEIRSTGGQTVVGPSIHPDGHAYHAVDVPAASPADPKHLAECVERLYAAVCGLRGVEPTSLRPKGKPVTLGPPPIDSNVQERAIAYLAGMPPAIAGAGGHGATYAAATALVHGFGLDTEQALGLLLAHYNPRCIPLWTEKELRHKCTEAAKRPHDRPYGWLRDAGGQDHGVDLSRFTMSCDPTTGEVVGHLVGTTGLSAAISSDDMLAEEPVAIAEPIVADPGPFPMELLEVPGFIGEVIAHNLTHCHRYQPAMALGGAITLMATLAGRKVRDLSGNRTNIYVVSLCPSGGGKDWARQLNSEILAYASLPQLEGEEDLASDSGLVSSIEDEPCRLFQIDEFGRFLRTLGNERQSPHLFAVTSLLLKLYSSAGRVFKGKAYSNKKNNKIIQQPCVVLHATTVAESFWSGLTPESFGDGFLARLLVLDSQDRPDRTYPAAVPVPESIIATARWWGEWKGASLVNVVYAQPRLVPTTPEAEAYLRAAGAEADLQAKHSAKFAGLWSRVMEQVRRLALIFACSEDHLQPSIGLPAAKWANALVLWSLKRLIAHSAVWIAENKFDHTQKRVVRMFADAGGRMTRNEFTRKTQYLTMKERQELLSNLVETGLIKQVMEETKGRARIVYETS